MQQLTRTFTATTCPIDLDAEVQAMVAYLTAFWDVSGLENGLETLVRHAFDYGQTEGQKWHGERSVSNAIHDLVEAREDHLETIGELGQFFSHHDGLITLFKALAFAAMKMEREWQGGWSFETHALALMETLREAHPGFDTLAPKGYKKGKKQRVAPPEFVGHDSGGACVGGFDDQTTISMVAYAEERDRLPPQTLISAVLYHSLIMAEYNRNIAIMKELAAFDVNCGFVNHELEPETPLLAKIMEYKDAMGSYYGPVTEEMLEQRRQKRAEWDALSPEEKAERKRESRRSIADRIKNTGL